MKKKISLILLTIILSLTILNSAKAVDLPISSNQVFRISIDGNIVDFTTIGNPVLLKTARTFVPERFFSKYLGYNGSNEESNAQIWLNDDKKSIEMNVNNPKALISGQETYMDYNPEGKPVLETMPYSYNGTNYLPLRFVCEAFGEKIQYQKLQGIHYINIVTKEASDELYEDYYSDWEDEDRLVGYMIIRDKRLYFNEVEIVKWKNQKRVKELGLNKNQMPNGYLILDKNKEVEIFDFADDAIFTFTDVNHLFIEENQENLNYTTDKLEEFLDHLNVYKLNDLPLSGQRIPYFIEVEDGKIKSLVEEFLYTI